jgi:hypothetical protein
VRPVAAAVIVTGAAQPLGTEGDGGGQWIEVRHVSHTLSNTIDKQSH